jgi:hypothetical protein
LRLLEYPRRHLLTWCSRTWHLRRLAAYRTAAAPSWALTLPALVLLLLTSIAHAEAQLLPGATDSRIAPYATGVLSIENLTDTECVAVRMRWRGGGPTMLLPAAVLPGKRADVAVILPPIAASQTYDIELLGREGVTLGRTVAEIAWPPAVVTRDAFIDPIAYDPFKDDYPAWPAGTKQRAFLVAAVVTVLLAGAPLIRHPQLRVAGVLLVVVGGCAALLWREQPVVEEDFTNGLAVFRTRRTAEIRLAPPPTGLLTPVYRSQGQMRRDSLTLHPGRGGALTLQPADMRLFYWRDDPDGSSSSSSSRP